MDRPLSIEDKLKVTIRTLKDIIEAIDEMPNERISGIVALIWLSAQKTIKDTTD